MKKFDMMKFAGLLLALIFLASAPTFSQFKNILLDSGTTGKRQRPVEPSVAISLKDPKNMVAGAGPDKVYYSNDGGATWTTSTLKSEYGVFGDPVLISDHKGNFYYFHLADPKGTNYESEEFLSAIIVQESNDDGHSWSSGVAIGNRPNKDHDKPWASIDRKNNLYLAWTEFDKYGSDDPNCLSRILFSSSSNGKKWSRPFTISQLEGGCKDDDNTPMGAVPVVNLEGLLFASWANDSKIFMDRSFDGGNTWLTNDLIIRDQPGGWNFDVPGLKRSNGLPVLAVDNSSKSKFVGSLFLTWADQRNGSSDTEVWFMRTLNYGDNWTLPMKISHDENRKHQFFPWMTVDQSTGYIYIVYYDRSNYDDDQTDVMLAYSTDGGASFRNVKVSDKAFTPTSDQFLGDYINIAASKGVIVPIWTRMDGGATSIWLSVINHKELESAK